MKVSMIVALVLLAGCGKAERYVASITGSATSVCMNGVTYYQFTSGAAVAYNPDGSVKTCK